MFSSKPCMPGACAALGVGCHWRANAPAVAIGITPTRVGIEAYWLHRHRPRGR